MQGTQYPTSNLVMTQLYQMIAKLEMPSITCVHTTQKETILVHVSLEKTFRSVATRPKVQELQHADNAQVRTEYTVVHRVYIVLQDVMTVTLTCCFMYSQKYNLAWVLHQLREVWTKDFKSSPTEDDDVQEDDVEMTGEDSGETSSVDEDPFEKQMRLTNEVSAQQLRTTTSPRYVKPQALDQLEEWIKENPIPYMSNDKFSQEGIFKCWDGRLSGHTHVERDRASLFFNLT